MAKKKPKELLDSERWDEFRQEYEQADDRSCAVLCAAYLDVCLEVLLLKALMHPEDARELLFSDTKPLGTFSAKINMAYFLNIIVADTKRDLDLIRKIRNEFSHELHGLTFKSDHIRSMTQALTTPDDIPEFAVGNDPRGRFVLASALLTAILEVFSMDVATTVHDGLSAARRLSWDLINKSIDDGKACGQE